MKTDFNKRSPHTDLFRQTESDITAGPLVELKRFQNLRGAGGRASTKLTLNGRQPSAATRRPGRCAARWGRGAARASPLSGAAGLPQAEFSARPQVCAGLRGATLSFYNSAEQLKTLCSEAPSGPARWAPRLLPLRTELRFETSGCSDLRPAPGYLGARSRPQLRPLLPTRLAATPSAASEAKNRNKSLTPGKRRHG